MAGIGGSHRLRLGLNGRCLGRGHPFLLCVFLSRLGTSTGKQKFSCKGVVRLTGQRAAIVIAAESKDTALEIAAKHGVAIESIVPVAEPTPPLKTAEKQPVEAKMTSGKLDARIEDILSAEDKELDAGPDDLDLDDDAGEASRRGSPTTKACPYCGEQILAVAVSASTAARTSTNRPRKPRQPLDDAAPSPGVPTHALGYRCRLLVVAILVSVVAVVGWLLRGIPSTFHLSSRFRSRWRPLHRPPRRRPRRQTSSLSALARGSCLCRKADGLSG